MFFEGLKQLPTINKATSCPEYFLSPNVSVLGGEKGGRH